MPPRTVQVWSGAPRFVVVITRNKAPGLLLKAKWSEPLGSISKLLITVGRGIGTLMFTTAPVLGTPLANTVASAKPGGKSMMGAETSDVGVQLVERMKSVCPLSRLRN